MFVEEAFKATPDTDKNDFWVISLAVLLISLCFLIRVMFPVGSIDFKRKKKLVYYILFSPFGNFCFVLFCFCGI